MAIGIIPARYASTRFPGKPLIDILGKSMIQRVYEQCLKTACLTKVYVATDDERIANHVRDFGGNVLMTSAEHQSGTDRCAEAASLLQLGNEVVINIQGDEPFIDPEQITTLNSAFDEPQTVIATLIKKLESEEDIKNPNIVKAIRNEVGNAIYFSRSPIPYRRNPEANIIYFKHVGIYAYRSETLKVISKLPQGTLEKAESLEQLRWLEAGYTITLKETDKETIAIDSPADLAYVEKMMKS